jgi:hypothetical protein
MLHEQVARNRWLSESDINEDPIHHIYLQNTYMMEQFVSYFPNATELTLNGAFYVPPGSIGTNSKCITFLKKLTKLTLLLNYFPFEQLIQLLQFTENVHTLKLNSISIQQSENFQIVPKTNTVTNVTVGEEMTLEKIQALTALFPRMEYLTMNIDRDDAESIAIFLLSKSSNDNRHLFSLCISYPHEDLMERLKIMIESENLLHDYILKIIDRKLYLWW